MRPMDFGRRQGRCVRGKESLVSDGMSRRRTGAFAFIASVLLTSSSAYAQTFGVELHNTLMPASGAMGGASIARPQDLASALNANPATLADFRGTQFMFGGAWTEPTYYLTQTSNIPIVGPPQIEPYSAKSTAPGTPVGNIGVTHDLEILDLPATIGLGFITTSGAFVDFRDVPESHGTNTGMALFSLPMAVGVDMTENVSLGASLAMGIAFFDGPFVGASGMTPDYALRGTIGSAVDLTESTTLGGYYQTEQPYHFDNAVLINPGPTQTRFDVDMDLPQNIGLGIANQGLMDGQLLLAVDLLYKLWDEASMYNAVYDNQWVAQCGAQYTMGRYKLRAGYVWAENPIDQSPGNDIGGVIQPGDLPAVRYTQALLAVTGQHRISGGVGVADILPGVDGDLMAGGMFRDTEQLGAFTETSIASYWIGLGLTWHFNGVR
jgi:long-chain fatty acid transport protein